MLRIGTAAGPWFLEAAVVEAGGQVSLRTRVLREPASPVTAPRLEINGAARECVAMYRYSRKAGAHEILDGTCYEYDAAGVRIDSIAVVAGGETGYRRRGLRLDPGRLDRVAERAREEAAPAGAALLELVLRLPGPVLDLGGRLLADMPSRGGAVVGCRAEESRALYPDRSFESVICHGLLDSASDPDEVATEAARLCRSEALFTVADSSTRPAGSFNRVNLAALLERHFHEVSFARVGCEAGSHWSTLAACCAGPKGFVSAGPVAPTFKLGAAYLFGAGKPQPWREADWRPPAIPSMICADEISFLHYLARTQYSGRGAIVEFGPLGGASTYALAAGAEHAVMDVYDFWRFDANLQPYFPGRDLRDGDSVLPEFWRNVAPFRDRIRVHPGDLTGYTWRSGPIEIVFVDAAKTPAALLHIVREFFPAVISGGWIVWQDYVSATCPWIHLVLEELSEYFEYWDSPEGGTIVTRLRQRLPRAALPGAYFEALPLPRAQAHFNRARGRLRGWEALDVQLAEALWLALSGSARQADKILQAVQQDPQFLARRFDYDLKFVRHWIEATRAGVRFDAT